jgi:hypothetical protein
LNPQPGKDREVFCRSQIGAKNSAPADLELYAEQCVHDDDRTGLSHGIQIESACPRGPDPFTVDCRYEIIGHEFFDFSHQIIGS